jgi:hypothetical protein
MEQETSSQHQGHPATSAAAPDGPAGSSATLITNHFDCVLECLDYMQTVEEDEQVEKGDVIEAIRARLHNMLSKILLNNSITSMSMLGWRIE